MSGDSLGTPYTLLSRLNHPSAASKWKRAWLEFVDRYLPVIYAWCFKRGLQQADVEDVSQEVLKKLYVHFPKYKREKGMFRAWLKTVANNALRDWFENQRRQKKRLEEYARMITPEAENDLVDLLEIDRMRELLGLARTAVKGQCEGRVWEAFCLTEDDGLSAQAAAQKLEITVASVFKYRQRVKRRLETEVARIRSAEEGA